MLLLPLIHSLLKLSPCSRGWTLETNKKSACSDWPVTTHVMFNYRRFGKNRVWTTVDNLVQSRRERDLR